MSVMMLGLLEAACFKAVAGLATIYLISDLSGAVPGAVCLSVDLSVGLSVGRLFLARASSRPILPPLERSISSRCSRPPLFHPFFAISLNSIEIRIRTSF